MAALPTVPPILKAIRPYIKVSLEMSKHNPVISYFCNFYAIQQGLQTNYKSSPEAKQFLMKLMENVEEQKAVLKSNTDTMESITDDLAGVAVVEAAAMKWFAWADTQDRSAVFNKSVVKGFYTASILFDVLEVFNEPMSEECKMRRKYARWKATYIHNCLKNNETPVPGPIGGLGDDFDIETSEFPSSSTNFPPADDTGAKSASASNVNRTTLSEESRQPKPAPRSTISEPPVNNAETSVISSNSLSPQDLREAEKMCKYAGSALQYEDIQTAIDNLEKCLRLLKSKQS